VFAHVTPTFDAQRNIIGYHSNRRRPKASAVAAIKPTYHMLLQEESKYQNKQEAMQASTALLLRASPGKRAGVRRIRVCGLTAFPGTRAIPDLRSS
jgi:hypothetical protein